MSTARPGGGLPPKTPEQLFLEHLPLVERAARHACCRYHFSPQEAEDFLSEVKLKLIDDGYAVLRKFAHGSSLGTFLATVVHNFAKDYANHLWGKWRPCAEATRLGPDAVLLDRLLTREGLTLAEATATMVHNFKVGLTPAGIAEVALRLPARAPRVQVGEEALGSEPTRESSGVDLLLAADRARLLDRALAGLRVELAKLPTEDRLILRFWSEGRKVVQIARTLRCDQKPLYPRIAKICAKLKAGLLALGIGETEVRELLRLDEADWP